MDKQLTNVIRAARTKYGLTQVMLHEITGIPVRTIQSWEGGKRIPPDYVVKLLLYYLKTRRNTLEDDK